MASVHKQPGKDNWFCAFTDSSGKRRFRSSGTPNKKQAQIICQGWAKAANLGRVGKLTPERARNVIASTVADVFIVANTESLPSNKTRVWADEWIRGKEIEKEPSTVARYRSIVNRFVASLGRKADMDLEAITPEDVARFRDAEAKRLSVVSANLALKITRALLSDACARQYIPRNPAAPALVKVLRVTTETKRRNLTLAEIKKLLGKADTEWHGLILCGVYLGQRLGDLARLKWRSIDFQEDDVALVTQKTGKRIRVPMAKALRSYFLSLDAPDDPDAPVFPKAAGAKRVGHLSNQFRNLLADVGLVAVNAHQAASGKGRSASRVTSELSFHSLRHSAVSMLKSGGASDAMARELIGHQTEAVSRMYTHFSSEDMRKAVNLLPDLSDEKARP